MSESQGQYGDACLMPNVDDITPPSGDSPPLPPTAFDADGSDDHAYLPHQHQHQHQHGGKPAASGFQSLFQTSRTRSQSSDGRSSWQETGGGGGWAEGEMEGSDGRRKICPNLSLSEFPQLAFLAQVSETAWRERRCCGARV